MLPIMKWFCTAFGLCMYSETVLKLLFKLLKNQGLVPFVLYQCCCKKTSLWQKNHLLWTLFIAFFFSTMDLFLCVCTVAQWKVLPWVDIVTNKQVLLTSLAQLSVLYQSSPWPGSVPGMGREQELALSWICVTCGSDVQVPTWDRAAKELTRAQG